MKSAKSAVPSLLGHGYGLPLGSPLPRLTFPEGQLKMAGRFNATCQPGGPRDPKKRLKGGRGGGKGLASNAGALRPFASRRFDRGGPQTTQTDAEPAGPGLRLNPQSFPCSGYDRG